MLSMSKNLLLARNAIRYTAGILSVISIEELLCTTI